MQYHYEYKAFTPEFSPSITMNYMIALPEDYQPGEKLPMVIFLHGAGERGSDPEQIRCQGIPKYIVDGYNVRFLLLAPQVPDARHVWNNLMDQTMELIEKTAIAFNVDMDRISLTGISMGGFGAWDIAAANSDYFSAIAPICGGGMDWRAGSLAHLPIRTFHGQADESVSVDNTLLMVDAINRISDRRAECILIRGEGHNCWDYAYTQTNLVEWLVGCSRKKGEIEYDI